MRAPVETVWTRRYLGGGQEVVRDVLAAEEPLEIRLGHGPLVDRRETRLSVTMRTPGNDEELALGFLFTEGIIRSREDVLRVVHCEDVKEEERGNVVRAELHPSVEVDPSRWQRSFYMSSSCGVCGKSSIDAVRAQGLRPLTPFGAVDPEVITALPERMRNVQTVFRHTGGIHAAALFDRQGSLLILREGVGRHNAVDKVVGAMLMADAPGRAEGPQLPPASDRMLLVSGRAGFELVQKCAMAGIPLMAALGAPSSLAVRLARETGLTLVGFLSEDRFNVYSGGS